MKQILADRPDWIDDPEHKGAPGPYNMPKKLYRPKKKDPKTTSKTKRTHAFGIDPSKDKPTTKRPVRKRKGTGKTARHGKGTYGAAVPSDTKYGKRKPLKDKLAGIKPPPRKPLSVSVPVTKWDNGAEGRARAIANLKPTDFGGIEAGSDVTPVRNTAEDNAQRARKLEEKILAERAKRARAATRSGKPSRHGPGTYGAVIPPRRGTPSKPPTKMTDPIDPAIEAKRKSVLAERARAAAAKAPPKQRWPGATTKRVSTRDKGVIETGLNLEPKGRERTPKEEHQDRQALKRLVEKYGGRLRDWWSAVKNRPLTDAEARAKAGLDATKQQVRSGEGLSAVKNYRGGQPKKKTKKGTSRRVKNKHSGYEGHDGNKLVAKYYSQENKMGPHTLLTNPPKLEKINGKPTGQGYGAARKGPDVKGTPHEEVVNSKYESGDSFKLDHNSVKNIHVR